MRDTLIPLMVLLYGACTFISCSSHTGKNVNSPASKPLFESVPTENSGITFQNALVPDYDMNAMEYNYFYNGGGVAAADFNSDGLTDLYFTGNQVSGKLYLNKGNFKFDDVTAKAGLQTRNWATGATVGDVNNDGLPDLYISYAGYKDAGRRKHQLFINNGKNAEGIPTFTDEAEKYGLADTSYTTQACFFDFDRDGDLDLVMINHTQDKSNPNYPMPKDGKIRAPDCARLYRNDNGRFSDLSKSAGIVEKGYGLGLCISDINGDGWPDIYITNDFSFDDVLYINNRNGTFTESLKKYIQHTSRFSMGCDIADYNNDSYPDILTLDMLPDSNSRQKMMNTAMNNDRFNSSLSMGYSPQYPRNMLQLNNGPNANGQTTFSEIGQLAGISMTDWSWSALFADLDNDGWKDLFITNGIPLDVTNNDFISFRSDAIRNFSDYASLKKVILGKLGNLEPVKKTNFIFKNQGDLKFTDQSLAWGMDNKGFHNGAVYVDLDNDGDLDLVTNDTNDYSSVYRNNCNSLFGNNYLRIKLNGPFSVGAKISIDCNGKKQFLEHNPVRGFQSSQDPIEHFGIGRDSIVDALKIVWLDGKTQQLVKIKANQLVTLEYINASFEKESGLKPGNVQPGKIKTNSSTENVFTDITETSGINYTHIENTFEDFDFEPLLPHRFSLEGPRMAVGDVDKNGLEDLWIGGPHNIPGKLFLQQSNGAFLAKNMPDSVYEDEGGVFFDANGDKNLDLYVVSGGNEFKPNSASYQDRLYINDGKGNFKRDKDALPKESSSGSCVVANDFNKDGAVDLFVGGRVTPGFYPLAPRSYLLQNDGKGKFSDVTALVCPELMNIGLVTAAIWSDFDNDGWTDLIVTGEWMAVTFFKNDNGKLIKWQKNPVIDESTGWFFSISEGDFDNDGDMDYIAGNLGLNNKFNTSPQTPLSVYTKDFDRNGTVESIHSYYLHGKEYTVADRDMITLELPSIKNKFDTYQKFADADFNQIFPEEDKKDALHLTATSFASVYLENKGNGKFVMTALPTEAQFSVVQSIQVGDFDGDGNLDAVIAGNYFSPDFSTGRYDASYGLLLKGNGNGGFTPVPASVSGISIVGDARATSLIRKANSTCLLVGINSGKLKSFKINKQTQY
ncbi:MAG: VCBS repeat-containing protein [Mariniphaga sp.]|nr:VCBS repeat-containing protein [Mariniphaga sp.]